MWGFWNIFTIKPTGGSHESTEDRDRPFTLGRLRRCTRHPGPDGADHTAPRGRTFATPCLEPRAGFRPFRLNGGPSEDLFRPRGRELRHPAAVTDRPSQR